MKVQEIITKLKLIPHPKEGGFFFETYRSSEIIKKQALPERYNDNRCIGTAIYYLLTNSTFSEMHRLGSDEIFHFYLGDPVEMLQLYPDGSSKIVILGNKILENMKVQTIVPRNVWQGAKLINEGEYALLGTTVAPGFEYIDYEQGNREELISKYPKYKNLITLLTIND
ncbi:MAG: cupin domain-containing protein [Candidatus Lokiarchaeota archaeon]|nr:cupin domain-containing protein [Candidatus Lokiarchaeota archaeon]